MSTPYDAIGHNLQTYNDLPDDFTFAYKCDNECGKSAVKGCTRYLSDIPFQFYCSDECMVESWDKMKEQPFVSMEELREFVGAPGTHRRLE